jgi:hypothetical protein
MKEFKVTAGFKPTKVKGKGFEFLQMNIPMHLLHS